MVIIFNTSEASENWKALNFTDNDHDLIASLIDLNEIPEEMKFVEKNPYADDVEDQLNKLL